VPTAGQFLRERDEAFDADGYDARYPDHAMKSMW